MTTTIPAFVRDEGDFLRLVHFGVTTESQVLEFKSKYEESRLEHRFELRKDVLSLANTWGGALLIGVTESKGKNYYCADSLLSCDIEAMKQWVTQTLKTFVFPVPDYWLVPLRVPNQEGKIFNILVVNIKAYPDGIGCVIEGDALKFPRRNEYGVYYSQASEVFAIMGENNIRRILILLNELGASSRPVFIASPVVRVRKENDGELMARVASTYPTTSAFTGSRSLPNVPRQTIEFREGGRGAILEGYDSVQLTLRLGNSQTLAIPIGLVKQVWLADKESLGIVLDCDIILGGEEPGAATIRVR